MPFILSCESLCNAVINAVVILICLNHFDSSNNFVLLANAQIQV